MSRSTGNVRRRADGDQEVKCTSCGKPTKTPKTGLCAGCYLRGFRNHTLGSACAICGTQDQRVLRRHKFRMSFSTVCANHSAIAGRRDLTLTELRAECFPPGDRRGWERRLRDRRTPVERRRGVDVETLLELPEERRKGRRR